MQILLVFCLHVLVFVVSEQQSKTLVSDWGEFVTHPLGEDAAKLAQVLYLDVLINNRRVPAFIAGRNVVAVIAATEPQRVRVPGDHLHIFAEAPHIAAFVSEMYVCNIVNCDLWFQWRGTQR